MTNYFTSNEIFLPTIFFQTKFYADFSSSDKVLQTKFGNDLFTIYHFHYYSNSFDNVVFYVRFFKIKYCKFENASSVKQKLVYSR